MNVGLLVVATGRYVEFVEPLWASARAFFLADPPHNVTLFVFTNRWRVPRGTVRLRWPHEPWPKPTLKRYHAFLRHERRLRRMDYLFYCDADMRFVAPVAAEVLGDLVATQHPLFHDAPRARFSYERRPESTACVKGDEGVRYFAGGFFGGRTERVLAMARTIRHNVEEDFRRGIVALWHDESHMNRYFVDHPPSVVLTPAYCFPEGRASLPFEPRLVALEKDKARLRRERLTLLNRLDLATRPLRALFRARKGVP